MNMELDFVRGRVDEVQPGVRRLIANNPSPFTYQGTNTYIVGRGEVAIIDPGPDDTAHLEALLEETKGEQIKAIIVTHTHGDHATLVNPLKARTGAPIIGCAPYVPSTKSLVASGMDSSHSRDYVPERILVDNETLEIGDFALTAIATPGHASNHLCYELAGTGALFSGDHVMGWSTSVVIPPDGDMADYMASLARLIAMDHKIYWPGHGGPVKDPQRFSRALMHHRRQREAAIVNRLRKGDRTIPEIVTAIYEGLDPKLAGAAGMSVLAHLEDLVGKGLVVSDGPVSRESAFRMA
ncbi:MAG: MBL fold metallo-hydrolase [Rhodobiaceae bacterium]|nr:MBL fold metallo-hydrolase [Rhodobiaceae bacterium]MCC0054756.1 MBL fold metallo-hydrolase [Rhodobiaceae bacterium]